MALRAVAWWVWVRARFFTAVQRSHTRRSTPTRLLITMERERDEHGRFLPKEGSAKKQAGASGGGAGKHQGGGKSEGRADAGHTVTSELERDEHGRFLPKKEPE